jgi:HNH endonuclease
MKTATRLIPELSEKNKERFWKKVNSSGGPDVCWHWTAAKDPRWGYGSFGWNYYICGAHRVSFFLAFGQPPLEKPCICHHCDNPSCVNPAHLFAGTHKDNAVDRNSKGRGHLPDGQLNGRCLLTESDVRDIRRLYASGELNSTQLSEKFQIKVGTIHHLLRGSTWGSLDPDYVYVRQIKAREVVVLKPRNILNHEKVGWIRTLHAVDGLSYEDLGERFGVTPRTIRGVVNLESWKPNL